MTFFTLIIILGTICCCAALQCYTGFKYVAGRSIGTSKIACPKQSDYCYNATADITNVSQLSLAGCSTTRCSASRNKCLNYTHNRHEFRFCCCNYGDLCNSKYTNLTIFEKVKQRVKDFTKIIG